MLGNRIYIHDPCNNCGDFPIDLAQSYNIKELWKNAK
jgi:hypothetical protein